MHGIAVEPKKKGDEQRLFEVLHKLEVEDPCFKLERHATTNETVIRGLGELHMRAKLEPHGAAVQDGALDQAAQVPYRETITRVAEGHNAVCLTLATSTGPLTSTASMALPA